MINKELDYLEHLNILLQFYFFLYYFTLYYFFVFFSLLVYISLCISLSDGLNMVLFKENAYKGSYCLSILFVI